MKGEVEDGGLGIYDIEDGGKRAREGPDKVGDRGERLRLAYK